MRITILISFSLATYLATSASANSTAANSSGGDLREECSAFSQAEMRVCLAKKVKVTQKALLKAEENAATALSKWDEDAHYIALAKAKLVTANKEFSKYRDIQCDFSASLTGGAAGNAHELGRLACIAELNAKRTEQLREIVSLVPLKSSR